MVKSLDIRLAKETDLKEIIPIIRKSVQVMEKHDNDQWTGDYPQEHDFLADIEKNTLYVAILDNKVAGCISVDQVEPEEYQEVNWRIDEEAYLFHRLAVDIDIRGEGVASELIAFAERLAIENGVYYMKVDTYSLNKKAQGLFEKLGYEKRGEIKLFGKEQPFYCYDKILSSP